MFQRFTPTAVIKQYQHQTIALVLILALFLSSIYYLVYANPVAATTTYTWSGEELALGTMASTTTSGGGVGLLTGAEIIDTTAEDFSFGSYMSTNIRIATLSHITGGEVMLNQGWGYHAETEPGIAGPVAGTFLENDLLYVSTWNNGLSVINTNGTIEPEDDTVSAVYNTSSTPALPVGGSNPNYVMDVKKIGNLLYIGTLSTGLSVFNTQGTVDSSDDVLIMTYNTTSDPAILSNRIDSLFIDTDNSLIYIGAFNRGVNVINTQGTIDPVDDTFLMQYSVGTTPGLSGLNVEDMFIDTDRNLLYISTNRGLSVINNQGTIDPTDDVLVIRYYTGSTPAIPGGVWTAHTFLDTDRNLLYVSTYLGLSVINTQGTIDPVDDTLVTTYNTGSVPATKGDDISHSFLDNNLLYVSTYYGGLSVINTQGTIDPVDDTLVTTYEVPTIMNNQVYRSFLDNGLLYLSNQKGLSVIDTSGAYNPAITFFGLPRSIVVTPVTSVKIDSIATDDHDVEVLYRTGTTSAVWREDFDTTDSYLGDFYEWGEEFQDISATGSVLTLSNPTGAYGAVIIDTGFGEEYFPAGTPVRARVRINTDNSSFTDWMFLDNWDGADAEYDTTNEWINITLVADQPFSRIGFEPWLSEGTWSPSDTFEIDWIEITTPDSMGFWNEWQTCADSTRCEIDPATLENNAWIQYRLDLSTTNPATTPVVHSVTLEGDYAPVGTYTSQTETFAREQELLTFSVAETVPASTTTMYQYSLDGGSTWQSISAGAAFPNNTKANSFTWRATLATENSARTPRISSVTLTTANAQSGQTSTQVQSRVAALEAAGLSAEAAYLRRTFPDVFDENGEATTEKINYGILIRIEKILDLMEKLAATRASELNQP